MQNEAMPANIGRAAVGPVRIDPNQREPQIIEFYFLQMIFINIYNGREARMEREA